MSRQAPGDLGKIQWAVASGLSAIDNLPDKAALILARSALNAIGKRVDLLNDRYHPVKDSAVKGVVWNKGEVVELDVAKVGEGNCLGDPAADSIALDPDDDGMQRPSATYGEQSVRLSEDLEAVPDSADVHSFFDAQLDRIFRGV